MRRRTLVAKLVKGSSGSQYMGTLLTLRGAATHRPLIAEDHAVNRMIAGHVEDSSNANGLHAPLVKQAACLRRKRLAMR
jgi:hypothetical protein